MRAQSTSYRDHLKAMLAYAQLKGEYLDWFRVKDLKNGHTLHIGDVDSDEEWEDCTPISGAAGDEGEVVPLQAGSSLYSYVQCLLVVKNRLYLIRNESLFTLFLSRCRFAAIMMMSGSTRVRVVLRSVEQSTPFLINRRRFVDAVAIGSGGTENGASWVRQISD